jgi:hypothetical protein
MLCYSQIQGLNTTMSHRSRPANRGNAVIPTRSPDLGTFLPGWETYDKLAEIGANIPDKYYKFREQSVGLDASREDLRHKKYMNRDEEETAILNRRHKTFMNSIDEDIAVINQRQNLETMGHPDWAPNYEDKHRYPTHYVESYQQGNTQPWQEETDERDWSDKKRWRSILPLAVGFRNEYQLPGGDTDERDWYEKGRWQGLVASGIAIAGAGLAEEKYTPREVLTEAAWVGGLLCLGAITARAVNKHSKRAHTESRSSRNRRSHRSSRHESNYESPRGDSDHGHRRRR